MLIKDEMAQKRAIKHARKEIAQQQLTDYVGAILETSAIYEDDDVSISNPQYQLGKDFTHEQFEAKLAKLNVPGLHVEPHPTKANVRLVYHNRPGGRVLICTYYSGVIPEFTIISRRRIIVTDPSYDAGNKTIDRKDLPKGEYKGIEQGWVYDPGVLQPGQMYAYEPGKILWRGWWSILAPIIHEGLITPLACEREFGVCSRPTWKAVTGQGGTTPF